MMTRNFCDIGEKMVGVLTVREKIRNKLIKLDIVTSTFANCRCSIAWSKVRTIKFK